MKLIKKFATMAALTLGVFGASLTSCEKHDPNNPFMNEYDTPYQIPPFDKISTEHYMPALRYGVQEQIQNISAIVENPEAPTFKNTIQALEYASPTLDKVALVFGALSESDATDEMQAIANEFMPAYVAAKDAVMMDSALFERVKAVYENRSDLTPAQQRLTEKRYKAFVRSGALLSAEDKDSLMAINGRLVDLYNTFNQNLLAANNEFYIVVEDSARLSGLPKSNIAQAAETASERGMDGKWVFTLHAPSRLPVLQYADDRDLRQQMYEGYTSQASSGDKCNYPVINKILQERAKKAKLLGYDNYGAYSTDAVMAKSVEAAEGLLMQIWPAAIKRVNEEVAEMQAYADAEGKGITIAPWDYYYYADKVRSQKYNFDEAEAREYFALDSVRNGMFTAANRLYGLTFTEMPDAPKYHPEVTVYDVKDKFGNHLAVFMTDYFPRATKRQGAWMSNFKESWIDTTGYNSRPVVYNVCSFSRPTNDAPALLTIDEVETMFHEFGHALHSMLTQVPYAGISGTNVDRDFVELPSQINEHWAFAPELLADYAHHYATGQTIPADLVSRMNAAANHNQGFATAELVGAALLDLQYSKLNPDSDIDIEAFERQVTQQLGMPSQLTYRYRSPYFKHIFGSDEYAAGYYTYLWAEVLDSDGFELFREKGIFDPETAAAFKHLLESGDSVDPMELYVGFRGHEPAVDALLRNRGL